MTTEPSQAALQCLMEQIDGMTLSYRFQNNYIDLCILYTFVAKSSHYLLFDSILTSLWGFSCKATVCLPWCASMSSVINVGLGKREGRHSCNCQCRQCRGYYTKYQGKQPALLTMGICQSGPSREDPHACCGDYIPLCMQTESTRVALSHCLIKYSLFDQHNLN